MADILIYQTSDPGFSDHAIETLQNAGIDCYRVGEGSRELNAVIGRWTDNQIGIYIRRQEDARRANEILVKLGAAVASPPKLPGHWVILLIVATLFILALVVSR